MDVVVSNSMKQIIILDFIYEITFWNINFTLSYKITSLSKMDYLYLSVLITLFYKECDGIKPFENFVVKNIAIY